MYIDFESPSFERCQYYSNMFHTFTSFFLILLSHPHLVWVERMFGINHCRFMARENVNCVPRRPSHLSSCSWTMFYYLGWEHDDTKPVNMSWTPKERGNLLKCSWINHTNKKLNFFGISTMNSHWRWLCGEKIHEQDKIYDRHTTDHFPSRILSRKQEYKVAVKRTLDRDIQHMEIYIIISCRSEITSKGTKISSWREWKKIRHLQWFVIL